jgi:hypothetical protein
MTKPLLLGYTWHRSHFDLSFCVNVEERNLSMSASLPLIRQMFHITLDIEATVGPETSAAPDEQAESYHRALVQALLAHPEILHQLLRSAAIAELRQARQVLEAEYSKGGVSEQDLLTAVMGQLEPEVQAYFTEEIEDHQSIYLLDGYAASIKHFQMTASPLQTSRALTA